MRYLTSYVTVFKRLLILLAAYTLCRILFWGFNHELFARENWSAIMLSMLKGIRFDISAILYTNIILALLALIPGRFVFTKVWQVFLFILFIAVNSFFLSLNISDIEYYHYTGSRSGIELFGMAGEILENLLQWMVNYWYLMLSFIVMISVIIKIYPYQKPEQKKSGIIFSSFIFLIFIGLCFLGIRGGAQLKPLSPIVAYSSNPRLGALTLNTPFTVIYSLSKNKLEKINYFTDNELITQLPVIKISDDKKNLGQNVVIFILESFSSEFVGHLNSGKGFTPFLDSLSKSGVSFINGYSNGRTSKEALPSILSSLPPLMKDPIISSNYQSNQFFSLFAHLQQFGYKSYFFHGGKNGTMGFDMYSKKLEFEYFGKDEYPDNEEDFDGQWGIFDEPYLQYFASKMDEFKSPFISVLFTLTSHQPYPIPQQYKERFDKGQHPIQNSIEYTDFALSKFFETACKSDWYKNTLFIITADHTHKIINKKYNNALGRHSVPIILFYPGQKLLADSSLIVQHTDILPSIADYLGVGNVKLTKFGKSFFQSQPPSEAVFFEDNTYYLIENDHYIRMIDDKIQYFNKQNQMIKENHFPESENRLKAYIQYFNNGMINNSLGK